MAITGTGTPPQQYRTVYNPIEYVLTSDKTPEPRFKYVIEVYDGATLLGTLRVPADPNSYGRCDIQGIAENYLTKDLGAINTTATGDAFTDNPNSYKEFTVKFGEEYETGGVVVVTMYPAFDEDIITFNGSLPNYRGSDLNFVDYQVTDYYLNYIRDSSARKWLTNAPKGSGINAADNQSVELTDEGWTYFLYSATYPTIDGYDLQTYNSSGVLTGTNTINNTVSPLTDVKMLKIPTAPNSINNIIPAQITGLGPQPLIASTDTSYKIILRDNAPSIVSETLWFNIDSECRYETRRLEFLNALGGFDCFNFTKA